jgi:uncharacterized membrane protein YeaQ/YmgE (transglycosylase-associated protein family)
MKASTLRKFFRGARLRVLSGLFTNLSAGWIGAVIILPNFSDLSDFSNQLLLITNIISAIVCLLLALWLEEGSNRK